MGIVDEFIKALKPTNKERPKAYSAEVSKIDDEGVVWVYLAGSEAETPTALSSSEVKAGDSVNVEWRNNKLYIAGNTSNPSAGTTRVAAVEQASQIANDAAVRAVRDAGIAQESAETAQEAAQSAQDSLKSVVTGAQTVEKAVSVMQTALEAVVDYDPTTDTTKEYFWHDANGAHVLGTSGDYRNDIDSNGMKIVDTATEDAVAEFGASGVTIGIEGEAYLKMDTQSMKLVDSNENPYFQISNLKETQDREITEQHTGWNLQLLIDGVTYYAVGLNEYAESVVSVTVNGVPKSTPADYILYNDKIYGLSYICLVANPTSTGVTVVDYYIDTESLKAYTIGIRASGSDTGLFSFAEGYEVAAEGRYSHAQNIGTDAIGFAQTVIGRYNTTNYGALIIGNGNSDSERSNAFTVDWSGNVEMALNTSASSGSTDYALYQAITALGWQNDVIE